MCCFASVRSTAASESRSTAAVSKSSPSSRAGLEHVVRAGAQLEVAIQDAQRLARRCRRVIRPEVVRLVVADVAHDLDAREYAAFRGVLARELRILEPEHEVLLVVAQLDV